MNIKVLQMYKSHSSFWKKENAWEIEKKLLFSCLKSKTKIFWKAIKQQPGSIQAREKVILIITEKLNSCKNI